MKLDWPHIRDAFILGVIASSGIGTVLGLAWLAATLTSEGCV